MSQILYEWKKQKDKKNSIYNNMFYSATFKGGEPFITKMTFELEFTGNIKEAKKAREDKRKKKNIKKR